MRLTSERSIPTTSLPLGSFHEFHPASTLLLLLLMMNYLNCCTGPAVAEKMLLWWMLIMVLRCRWWCDKLYSGCSWSSPSCTTYNLLLTSCCSCRSSTRRRCGQKIATEEQISLTHVPWRTVVHLVDVPSRVSMCWSCSRSAIRLPWIIVIHFILSGSPASAWATSATAPWSRGPLHGRC